MSSAARPAAHASAAQPLRDLYADEPSFETAMMGHFATGAALVDINGDRLPDLVVANGNDMSPQPVVVFYNHSSEPGAHAAFNPYPDWYSGDVDYHAKLSVGDIDGDGRPDLAVAVWADLLRDPRGGGIKIYMNRDGALERTPSARLAGGVGAFDCALADVNADGRLDLVAPAFMMSWGGGEMKLSPSPARIYLNRDGRIDPTPAWTSASPMVSPGVVAADINQDGWMDLAFAAENTAVMYGHAPTSADVPISTAPDWTSSERSVFSPSIDAGRVGRGKQLSLVVSSGCVTSASGCRGVFLLYRPEQGNRPVWRSVDAQSSSLLLLADLNADNHLDLVAGQWGLNEASGAPLWLFQGTADGFPSEPTFQSAKGKGTAVSEGLAVADLRGCAVRAIDHTFKATAEGAVITLPTRRVESIVHVKVNGKGVPRFAFAPGGSAISLSSRIHAGDAVEVRYRASPVMDIVEATWNPDRGNLVFNSFLSAGRCGDGAHG